MRKNVLYGPRLQGDLDLGLEPTRTRGTVKDWARMDFPGGRLPGQSEQHIYELSATQKYRVGTRRVQDERTYHYCHASANGCAQPYWGAQDSQKYKSDDTEDCIEGVTVAEGSIGDLTLAVLDTNAAHVADFFAGGWAVLTVGSTIQMLRIRSNTAGGTSVTLTFWDPLAITVALGSQIQVFPSYYRQVERILGGGDPAGVTVCVPNMIVPASNYFWGQTWGPCYGIPSEAFPRGSYEQDLVFNHDGSIKLRTDGANLIHQRAGYRLFNYVDDPTGALVYYMLQLAP